MTAVEARTRAENYNRPNHIESVLSMINTKASMGMFDLTWNGYLTSQGITELENMGYIIHAYYVGEHESYAKISW